MHRPNFKTFWTTEKEKWKRMNGRERLQYLWDYEKIPIFAAALVLVLGIYALCYHTGRGKTDLFIVLVNTDQLLEEEARSDDVFHRLLGDEKKTIQLDVDAGMTLRQAWETVDTDVQTMQVLSVLFGIGDMDVFAADPDIFTLFAEKDGFEDLGLLLPQEWQAAHPDLLIRYTNEGGQSKAGGLRLLPGSPLHEAGIFSGEAVIGIASRAAHLEDALRLIRGLSEAMAP